MIQGEGAGLQDDEVYVFAFFGGGYPIFRISGRRLRFFGGKATLKILGGLCPWIF